MGKKIPAKKHHGIKDPLKQNEQRMAKIKMKINEAPSNVDEQEVPKKLKLLFKGKDKIKKNTNRTANKNEKKSKIPSKYLPQRPLKPIPKLERRPGEKDREFLWRTELATRNFLNKVKFEDKYDVDVITDQVSGEVDVKKRDLSYLDDGTEEKPKTKKQKKQAKQKVIKQEKLKAKREQFKQKKLLKKSKNVDEFQQLKQDKVEFGEVVHQPPVITAKPRKADEIQPGKRDLLLKNLIPGEKPSTLSGKRKDLSALDRQRLEEERQRAVLLYRELQKSKQNTRLEEI